MTFKEKARIREIQEELRLILVEGDHIPEEADALQEAIDELEQSVAWTT